MTKQTFTTGQVLTAAQMTSLQQTAMLGGAANAKTASYVLVAADAGDAITMSNASATTITVNTGLFAAGDIVTIINLGAGVSTITAGTATVSTSGSLALAQNQGGVLRFTSASAAIFFQFATPASGDITEVQAGVGISVTSGTGPIPIVTNSSTDLITTAGDLLYGSAADTMVRLGIGSTGNVLTVASGVPSWAAPAAGGSLTLLSTTTLTSTSNAITIAPTGYTNLLVLFREVRGASNNTTLFARFNSDTGNNNTYGQWRKYSTGSGDFQVLQNQSSWEVTNQLGTGSGYSTALSGSMDIWRVNDTSKIAWELRQLNFNDSSQAGWYHTFGNYQASAAITNLTLIGSTNLAGTVYVYGVK